MKKIVQIAKALLKEKNFTEVVEIRDEWMHIFILDWLKKLKQVVIFYHDLLC